MVGAIEFQVLKGVPKSLARWSDLGTFGSFLVPMYGGPFQVASGNGFVEANQYQDLKSPPILLVWRKSLDRFFE